MIKLLSHKNDKNEVTNFYLDIVQEAIKNSMKQDVHRIYSVKEVNVNDTVVTTTIDDAFKILLLKQNVKIVNWYQGVRPEESFMRNESKLRYRILSKMEKEVLKKAYVNLFVSEEMKRHYERKYQLTIKNSYIMPCFNEEINKEAILNRQRSKPVFTYVGGLAEWQCFDETLGLYKKIEDTMEDAYLKVFTPDLEEANKKVKAAGIKRCTVTCVAKEELNEHLKDIQYGFLLRQDDVVNHVATPTKMCNYVANGIVPIYSNTVRGFKEPFEHLTYKIVISPTETAEEVVQKILLLNGQWLNREEQYEQIFHLFDTYYSREKHVRNLSNVIKAQESIFV